LGAWRAKYNYPMTARLTIVLPLKGRNLFTLRFLWHANKARLPHRFLIADGEVHPELARLLENSRGIFPELDIEYIRYPDDTDFHRYYAKMADALQRVRTPYVKIADNDDFLAPAGLEYCIGFLDTYPDYVCCSGGIGGFSVHPSPGGSLEMVIGPLNKLTYCYAPRDRSIDLNSSFAMDRVLAGLRNTWNFYAVFRASALAQMWKEVRDIAPTSLTLKERFLAMRALTMGKGRSEPGIFSYWRQYWTSLQLHWTSSGGSMRKDFVYYLLRSRFTGDFSDVIDRVSRLVAECDGGDPAEIAERLREPLEEWVRDIIRLDFGAYATLRRHLRAHSPWFVTWLKTRHRSAVVFERGRLLSELRRDGASPEYVAKFKGELAEIEEVLVGQEFRAFLCQNALRIQPPR
jgi:glycosyltransferase domain-containing protein